MLCFCDAYLLSSPQKSLIDPFSVDGEKPEKFDGSVEFRDIFFNYPTRPDVKVSSFCYERMCCVYNYV